MQRRRDTPTETTWVDKAGTSFAIALLQERLAACAFECPPPALATAEARDLGKPEAGSGRTNEMVERLHAREREWIRRCVRQAEARGCLELLEAELEAWTRESAVPPAACLAKRD